MCGGREEQEQWEQGTGSGLELNNMLCVPPRGIQAAKLPMPTSFSLPFCFLFYSWHACGTDMKKAWAGEQTFNLTLLPFLFLDWSLMVRQGAGRQKKRSMLLCPNSAMPHLQNTSLGRGEAHRSLHTGILHPSHVAVAWPETGRHAMVCQVCCCIVCVCGVVVWLFCLGAEAEGGPATIASLSS